MYPAQYFNLDAAAQSGCPMFKGSVSYLTDFLGKKHPALEETGHHGTVCPFTPKVLENKSVIFTRHAVDMQAEDARVKTMERLTQECLPTFLKYEGSIDDLTKKKLACVVIVVVGPSSAEECNLHISSAQKEVQPSFVEQGLLLSELHPHSEVPSVRNAEFCPSRPPFPIFFVRRLIPNDIPYILRKDRYDEATYERMLTSLIRIFGVDVIVKEMTRLGKQALVCNLTSDTCRYRGGKCNCVSFMNPLFYGFFMFKEPCYRCENEGILIRELGNVVVNETMSWG